VYIVLQHAIRKASRQIVFVNTSPPDERVELLKPLHDIQEMDDDCEDNYTSGLINSYPKCPAQLEHLTLADWAAWYDCSGKPCAKQTNQQDIDGLPLENFVDDNQTNSDDDDDKYNQFLTQQNKITNKGKINLTEQVPMLAAQSLSDQPLQYFPLFTIDFFFYVDFSHFYNLNSISCLSSSLLLRKNQFHQDP